MASDVIAAKTPAAPAGVSVPHARRFLAVYALLAASVCGAAALGLAVGLGHSLSFGSSGPWSTWQPTGGGLGLVENIATHIGGEYRLGNNAQLLDILAKPPILAASTRKIALGYVAVRGTSTVPDGVAAVDSSNTVMYSMCGRGPSCSIATGTPSLARGHLVLREILELALYTFHYDNAINNVIAFMPPSGSNVRPPIIFFQRADLALQLSAPLDRTLSNTTPSLTMTARDQASVEALAGQHFYSYGLTQAPDGSAVLLLTHHKA